MANASKRRSTQLEPPKILLISEDLPAIREALLEQGCRVLSVPDALAGLQAAIALDIVLVMIDTRFARARGIEIVPHIRNAKPELPIVMLTASLRRARRSPGDLAYLVKGSPEIPKRVKQILSIRES